MIAQITEQMHTEQTLFGTTINDAKSFFNALDHDRTGALDREELKQGLRRLGIAVPTYLLDALLVKMDANQNGLIELKEVARAFRPEPVPLDEGKVKELRRRSIELGLTLREANAVSPEELQELLEGAEGDGGSPTQAEDAARLRRELQEKERLLEEARKEIEREKARHAAEASCFNRQAQFNQTSTGTAHVSSTAFFAWAWSVPQSLLSQLEKEAERQAVKVLEEAKVLQFI